MASWVKSKKVVGRIITAAELSTIRMMLPSMTQAAAVSGRSVYRTFGKGLHHCLGRMASATLSCAMVRELAWMFWSLWRSSSSRAWSTRSSR